MWGAEETAHAHARRARRLGTRLRCFPNAGTSNSVDMYLSIRCKRRRLASPASDWTAKHSTVLGDLIGVLSEALRLASGGPLIDCCAINCRAGVLALQELGGA